MLSKRTCQGGEVKLSQFTTNHPRFNTSLLQDYDIWKRVGCDMLDVNRRQKQLLKRSENLERVGFIQFTTRYALPS
jgi:hypothetical protein